MSGAQLATRPLQYGLGGMMAFSVQWLLWHDLVAAGGRFTAYQMDALLLDVAPLAVLAASGAAPAAASLGRGRGRGRGRGAAPAAASLGLRCLL